METSSERLAQDYEDSAEAGRKFIRQYWSVLRQSTKDWLVSSKHYGEHGESRPIEYADRSDEIESLEYDLGVLERCAAIQLPARTSADVIIPSEVFGDEILTSAGAMVYRQRGHEPSFLRLALTAVRVHQMAQLQTSLPAVKTSKSDVAKLIGVFILGAFCMVGVLISPALIGSALTHAAKGDSDSATLSLYGLGFVLLLIGTLTNLGKTKQLTPDEVAYEGWLNLNPYVSGPWLAAGTGAGAYLENMMRKGATVPPIALDLCAVLTARMTE